MSERWSFAATEGDGHVSVTHLPRKVNLLSDVLPLNDLEPARQELKCTLLGAEESQLSALNKVRGW